MTVLVDVASQSMLIPSAPYRSMGATIPFTVDKNVWTFAAEDVFEATAERLVLVFRPDPLWFAVGCPSARLDECVADSLAMVKVWVVRR